MIYKILACFIVTVFLGSCNNSLTKEEVETLLRGNTFVTTFKGMDVSLTINFQDSTNTVFENDSSNNKWKIVSNDSRVYLIQDGGVIEICEVDSKVITGKVITNDFLEVRFEKQDVIYNIEDLKGVWVEEKYLPAMESANPPPPPPPGPEGTTGDDYHLPPIYEITKDSISVRYQYRTEKSEFLIFNSVCCAMMKLNRESEKTDKLWEIINVTDSVLTINRSSVNLYSRKHYSEENVRFIKIEN